LKAGYHERGGFFPMADRQGVHAALQREMRLK
jgi:hypothetical protein